MPDQNELPAAQTPIITRSPLGRLAHPFLLFAGTSALFLALSFTFLLPRLTRVEIGGREWQAEEIATERTRLGAEVLTQEATRRSLVLTLQDPLYDALKERRSGAIPFLTISEEIARQALAVSEISDAVHLDSISYDPLQKTVRLTGDVRGVGTQSMTVLAQFVDLLGRLPSVARVATPEFRREDDPVTGPHSPFSFALNLR